MVETPPVAASGTWSPPRTVVHLVRHGEVDNPDGVLYGRLPGFVLSERGEAMAERVADALADRDIIAIWSSPLERARQTAAPLASRCSLGVDIDDRVIEAANKFEGQRVSVDDGALKNPRHWHHLRNPFRPSWGEPYHQVADRMRAAVIDARNAARGHEIAIVSHQLPVWISRLSAEGRRLWHDPRKRQCALASVTSFVYDGNELQAITYQEPAGELLRDASPLAGA